MIKHLPANAEDIRDTGSIPGSGRCPEVGSGNPLQCSCLKNPMDRGAWQTAVHGVTKSQTQRSTHKLHQTSSHITRGLQALLWAVDILVKTVFSSSRACSNKQSQHNMIKLLMMIKCGELIVGRGGIFNPVWRGGEFPIGDCT